MFKYCYASIFIADCTWDFFSCTNKFGTWPDNKLCCESRFDRCCEKVNGPKKKMPKPETSSTSKPTTSGENSGGEGLQLSKWSNLESIVYISVIAIAYNAVIIGNNWLIYTITGYCVWYPNQALNTITNRLVVI